MRNRKATTMLQQVHMSRVAIRHRCRRAWNRRHSSILSPLPLRGHKMKSGDALQRDGNFVLRGQLTAMWNGIASVVGRRWNMHQSILFIITVIISGRTHCRDCCAARLLLQGSPLFCSPFARRPTTTKTLFNWLVNYLEWSVIAHMPRWVCFFSSSPELWSP